MFRIYRSRRYYWSCSKFADWFRRTFSNIPKLHSGTSTQWKEWKKAAKDDNQFVYWFTEEFLNKAQNFFMFPYDVWDGFRVYVRNRYISKTHLVSTHLKKGEWHETEEVLLHSMFELLVDFVEIEQASMALWNEENRKEYKSKTPWWNRSLTYRFGQWRSRELGIKSLEWAMTLKHGDGDYLPETDSRFGTPTNHAKAACEIMDLYIWWKDVRPVRPTPDELSGRTEAFKNRFDNTEDLWDILDRVQTKEEKDMYEVSSRIEIAQHEEDTDMMVRLIKVRSDMWT
jgi:hypothetical protein